MNKPKIISAGVYRRENEPQSLTDLKKINVNQFCKFTGIGNIM